MVYSRLSSQYNIRYWSWGEPHNWSQSQGWFWVYFYNLMMFLNNFEGMCSFAGKISQHIISITHELSSWYSSITRTFFVSDTTMWLLQMQSNILYSSNTSAPDQQSSVQFDSFSVLMRMMSSDSWRQSSQSYINQSDQRCVRSSHLNEILFFAQSWCYPWFILIWVKRCWWSGL